MSWKGPGGSLWLSGGDGYAAGSEGYLNDLWKWDGTTWTWVSGSSSADQPGTYGTKGVAAPGNVPGGRRGSVSWTDASGNLWLFGGEEWIAGPVYGDIPIEYLNNDLWKWDGTNWTWVSGSTGPNHQPGTYGTKGVAAPGNSPGARKDAVSWIDATGNFWLFGGYGYAASGVGHLNDLWKWDGTSWTWVSGSNAPNQAGTYGTKGVAAHGNEPGARYVSVSWTDSSGNLWLFGGVGYVASGVGYLNDLWKWDGTSWTWVSGLDEVGQSGTYGEKGSAAPGTAPGARGSSVSWTDGSGNLWLFGGNGVDSGGAPGSLNDLWVFGAECGYLAPPMVGNGGSYGVGATITLNASTISGATYFWAGPNGFTSTAQNPTIPNATTAMAGSYSVTATVGGCTSWGTTTVVVLAPQTLTVTKIGTGGGLVVSDPTGISCGAACAAAFPAFSEVTFTATADAGSRFAGWAGEGCFGTNPCTVLMDGAKSVTAMLLPAGGVGFHTVTPCRVVDTRSAAGPYGGPALEAGTARAFAIAGQCGVPADAAAVALNVTITNPTSAGHLTVYPGTGAVPGTSTISFAAGRTRANNATVALIEGLLSLLDSQATGSTDVIVDVSGYYR